MMSVSPLRVVQVGVGNYGAERRRLMRKAGCFQLVAAYDRNPAALVAAQREDGARPVDSYEALLDTPGIEAVIISTGAKYHAAQMIAAMQRGLPVFVEKPLCATREELAAILEAQRVSGVVVGVGHVDHRHLATSRAIQALMGSGALGALVAVERTTAHSGGFHIKPGDWRGDPERNPGGMLFQCGVHAFHELMHHFGPIAEVSAMMRHDVHETLTADAAVCLLRFSSGLLGTLNAYHVTPYRHTLAIFGTRASLYRDDRYHDEGSRLLLQHTRLDNGREALEPVPVEDAGDEAASLRQFAAAVRGEGTASPSLVDGARAVAAVFAAEASALAGRPERVADYMGAVATCV